jgi:hypothetical protein
MIVSGGVSNSSSQTNISKSTNVELNLEKYVDAF